MDSAHFAGLSLLIPNTSSNFSFKDFIHFYENAVKNPYCYVRSYYADTTGDGKEEKITSHIAVIGNQIHIQNSIRDLEGNELWNDKIALSREQGRFYFGDERIFDHFFPISGIYAGKRFSTFIDSLKDKADFDRRKKELLRYLAGYPAFDELQAVYSSSMNEFLNRYQGKLLFTLDPYSPDVYAWSKDKNAFVLLRIS